MNDWFRSWHGAPTDPKWLLIAKRANMKPIHVMGTWWALLDFASQHSDRGSIDGFDTETFALFAGLEDEHVSRIVTTLCDKGLIVDGRIVSWGKRQPKREDETAAERKRKQRSASPKNVGNPPRNGPSAGDSASPAGDGHAMSRNVTTDTDTDTDTDENSVANATGTVVPHPAADFAKVVFDSGIALLTGSGIAERDARSIIGRWRKKASDAEMITILRQAEIEQPSAPVEWVAAAVEQRSGSQRSVIQQADSLRGSRPDPSLDMWRQAQAEIRAAEDQEFGRRDWPALPSNGSGGS